jgi:hypothetical protein
MLSRCCIRTNVIVLAFCFVWIGSASSADFVDIEASLSKVVDFEFTDTPLDEALTELSRRFQVPIVTDPWFLPIADESQHKSSITHRASQVPLGKALEAMLDPLELAWVVRHDVVHVTTAAAAAENYHDTRVYQVTRRVPVERRLRSIIWSVAPESWTTAGGTGDAAPLPPKLMLVYQSPLRHRRIAASFADSVVPVRARPVTPSTELEVKLDAPTTLEFAAVPLLDAIEQLAGKHAVAISIDQPAIDEAGISMDDLLVTLHVGKIRTLASGLSLLLETADRELEWIVDDGAITITTGIAAEEKPIRRVYDIQKILPDGGFAQLLEAIQYTVASSTWEDVGGNAKIEAIDENTKLEVWQSDPVHRALRQLFADIQAGQADPALR